MTKSNLIFNLGVISGLIMKIDITDKDKDFLIESIFEAASIIRESDNK